MNPVDQTIFEPGKGNCFAACLASIMELSIKDIVHFPEGGCPLWRDLVNAWLSSKGMFFLDISLNGDMRDNLVRYWGYHIIMGDSPRFGDIRHAVVGFRGKMVFDPHPSRSGLIGDDFTYGILINKLL